MSKLIKRIKRFQPGGNIGNLTTGEKILYKLSYPLRAGSKNIMNYAQNTVDNEFDLRHDLGDSYDFNSPRNNFLVPKRLADIAMREEGWIRGSDEDYGPITNYVHNNWGNLPVYQKQEDYNNITRGDLVAFGNNNSAFSNLGYYSFSRSSLPDPENSATVLYIDPYTNKLYQKQWDVEKFGNGQSYSSYSKAKKLGAKALDLLGHKMVLTTGFQPVSEEALDFDTKKVTYGKHYTLDDLLRPSAHWNFDDPRWVARKKMDEFMSKRKVDSNPQNNGLSVIEDVDGTGRNVYGLKELEVRPENK